MNIKSRLSMSKSITAAILALIICAALFFYIPRYVGNNINVYKVINGHPSAYPSITYGQAFDKFFANPSWHYEQGSDGTQYVTFTGRCTYNGIPSTASITYYPVDEQTIRVMSASINGAKLDAAGIKVLNNTPFENYK